MKYEVLFFFPLLLPDVKRQRYTRLTQPTNTCQEASAHTHHIVILFSESVFGHANRLRNESRRYFPLARINSTYNLQKTFDAHYPRFHGLQDTLLLF